MAFNKGWQRRQYRLDYARQVCFQQHSGVNLFKRRQVLQTLVGLSAVPDPTAFNEPVGVYPNAPRPAAVGYFGATTGYDANGNMINDPRKGTTISYNYVNPVCT